MPVVVIDGGASNARALAASDDGRVLGAARGPAAAAGPVPTAEEAAATGLLADHFVALLTPLVSGASDPGGRAAAPRGIGGEHPHVIAGLAGTARPTGAARAESALRQALQRVGITPDAVVLTTDVHLALQAVATEAAGPASVLLAGTGSVALAMDGQGRSAQAGGYGRHLSDEGGGFWLGVRALAAAARATDGRAPEARALGDAALAALGLADLDALVEAAPALWGAPQRVAALAPLVLRLALAGDPAAEALLTEAGARLAELALAARGRLALPASAPLGYGGGLLAAYLAEPEEAAAKPRGSSPTASGRGGPGPSGPPRPVAGTAPAGSGARNRPRFPNPLPAAVRRHLPDALAERWAPLTAPPAVGAACRWLAERSGPAAARRLLRQATRWDRELA